MKKQTIHAIYGPGTDHTEMALGKGFYALTQEKRVIIISFLKGRLMMESTNPLKLLEPDMKFFSFEKFSEPFSKLSDKEREEECVNIRNGLNFAKKVLTTSECDVLILDDLLGLLSLQIIDEEECINLLLSKVDEMTVIFTGTHLPERLRSFAQIISKIDQVNIDNISE